MATIRCPGCGNAVSDENKFCTHCGCDLRASDGYAKMTQAQPQSVNYVQPRLQDGTGQEPIGFANRNSDSVLLWKSQSPKARKTLSVLTGLRWTCFGFGVTLTIAYAILCLLVGIGSWETQLNCMIAISRFYYPSLILTCIFISYYQVTPIIRDLYTTFSYSKWIKKNNINVFDNPNVCELAEKIKNNKLKKRKDFSIEIIAAYINERPDSRKGIAISDTVSVILGVIEYVTWIIFVWYDFLSIYNFSAWSGLSDWLIFIVMGALSVAIGIANAIYTSAYGKEFGKKTRAWLLSR